MVRTDSDVSAGDCLLRTGEASIPFVSWGRGTSRLTGTLTRRNRTLWYRTLWYRTLWYRTLWYRTLWYRTLWNRTLWYRTLWNRTLWYRALVEVHWEGVWLSGRR